MKNQLYYLPLLLLLLLCSPTPSTAQQQDTYRRWSDIFPNGGPVISDLPGGEEETDPPVQQVQYGLQPSCNQQDSNSYNICLDLVSVRNEFQPWMRIFEEAIQKWQTVIVGDVPSQSSAGLPTTSQFMCTEYPRTIDDIYLCGKDANIDGVGRVLGGAAPLFGQELDDRANNPRTGQPYFIALSGILEFDIADIDREIEQGRFLEIVKHEIGHVIGVGSELWNLNGVYDEGDASYGRGTNAEREFHDLIGCDDFGLPVELDGGRGTAGSHWDETCLQDEIMTGFISGVEQPFSRITVGTLEDMGYEVDYDQADPFFRSQLGGTCRNLCRRRLGSSSLEEESSTLRKRPQRQLTSDETKEVLLFAKSRLDWLRLGDNNDAAVGEDDGIFYIGGKTMDVFYVDDNNDLHVIGVSEEQVRDISL